MALLILCLAACGGETRNDGGGRSRPAGLVEVPRPKIDSTEFFARRLGELHDRAEALRTQPGTEPATLAATFGGLGKHYAAFGFLEAADAALRNAEAAAPADRRWPHFRGLVAFDRGDLEAAAGHFERALELEPGAAESALQLGIALLELRRPDDARRTLRRALELDPRSAAAHQRLGQLAADGGDPRSAVEHFRKALELAPEASVLHHSLGLAHRDLGELDEARRHLALQGETDVPLDDPLLGELTDLVNVAAFEEVLARVGREDFDAVETLDFALRYLGGLDGNVEGIARYLDELRGRPEGLDPRYEARLHFLVGGFMVRRGEDGAAVERFRTAIDKDPGLAEAHVKLGNALARAGRNDEALRSFSDALELEPGHVSARVRRAVLRTRAGRLEEAAADYRAALRFDPGSIGATVGLAHLDGHAGRFLAALDGYRRALDLEPDHRPARLGEVVALLLLERYADARARLDAALRELPPDAAFAHLQARLLASAPDAALRNGARALELIAGIPEIRRDIEGAETVAMAYAEAGRFEEARSLQRDAVARLDAADARRALGEARLRAYEEGRPWRAGSPGELIPSSATPAAASD